jgi:hypothetical protein
VFDGLKHFNALQSMLSVFIPKRVVSSSGTGSTQIVAFDVEQSVSAFDNVTMNNDTNDLIASQFRELFGSEGMVMTDETSGLNPTQVIGMDALMARHSPAQFPLADLLASYPAPQPIMATSSRASNICLMVTAFRDRSQGRSHSLSLHPLYGPPKRCRVHWQRLRRRAER